MSTISEQLIENLEMRARSAEEIIQSLEKQIQQITVSRMLNDLKAENESLTQQVASLISQLETLERANLSPGQQVLTTGRQHNVKENVKLYESDKKETANKLVSRAVLKKNDTSAKCNNQMEEKKMSVEKADSDKTKRKEDKKDSGGKSKAEKSKKAETAEEQLIDVGRLDFRVGKIVKIQKHPDADSLYVEEIDIGEEKPRTIVSGLVKHVAVEEMQNRNVIVLCNLKPAKMRGVTSEGMVMCASSPEKVEVLDPPQTCLPGDVVVVDGYTRNPDPVLNPKKKIFETVAVDLKTNDVRVATYKNVPLSVPGKGVITSQSLTNVCIK